MAEYKKIVIFGSTGNTGLCCVEEALKLDYEITAFLRDPSKLPEELTSKVKVIVGDVLKEDDVETAIQGQDAVIIVLGTRNDCSPTTMMSKGTKNILEAMQKSNVKRVSVCASAFNFWDREKVPERFHNILDDHTRMLDILKNCDREWVAVLPPHITNDAGTKDYMMEHGKGPGRTISKYDLAHFMVTCFTEDKNLKQWCGLCDKPQ
ncbi:unnamed protein product [Meganyctiphanes norvegica]|uniref:NAD(P)-binding domain-containing protein n=1 Tax=Meganyctiphanes norvegica TaxID=48144 RepID=A0AAV2SJ80_MEGNR